jgi:para-aminobenzoate synthetase/4-amino-4-deoxychorismate lyase
MDPLPSIVLESFSERPRGFSYRFEEPVDQVVAWKASEVIPTLERLEDETRKGLHCAGYLAYEAASAWGLETHPQDSLPLLWFRTFRKRRDILPGWSAVQESNPTADPSPSINREEYDAALQRIHEYILAGDTYQVNFTFRLRQEFRGNPFALYQTLARSQRAHYCAFLDFERWKIASVSPELFFERRGNRIRVRPMKGTGPRGRWPEEDVNFALALQDCPKNRAENLMIVDLMRNDLGRIARTGSVRVRDLFTVEPYGNVHQMTSTVEATLRENISLPELFSALFPSGSVTGAPKIRTMQIIRELESTPRGVYTGAIGFLSPGGHACFNVAIRTAVIDMENHQMEFGVGGGITHDSAPISEFQECLLKARILSHPDPEFQLFETLLYDPPNGFFLLDRHLRRMQASAAYFGFRMDLDAIVASLEEATRAWTEQRTRVRLLLEQTGTFTIESQAIPDSSASPLRICIAEKPVDSRDPFLFHKTTHRAVYESRAAAHPDFDDVLLLNERGELTESCRANLVAEINGLLYTPPIECGLLGGTFRAELLKQETLIERVLRPEDLRGATALHLINSVRKWIPARLLQTQPSSPPVAP